MYPHNREQQAHYWQTSRPIIISHVFQHQRGTSYRSRFNFNPSDEVSSCPVKETNTTLTFDTKEDTSSKPISRISNVNTTCLLLEIQKDFDTCGRLPDCIIIAIFTPSKVEGGPESL